MTKELVEVLVPIPLEGKFSYKIPSGLKNEDFQPGVRVEVPFGKRTLIGIVWGKDLNSDKTIGYKNVIKVLDKTPLISKELLGLADWSSRYYHHPLGEVISYFLTPILRKGKAAEFLNINFFKLSIQGDFLDIDKLSRAPNQKKALLFFRRENKELSQMYCKANGISSVTLANLCNKGLLKRYSKELVPERSKEKFLEGQNRVLTKEQKKALALIKAKPNKPFLLNGITGSGKTEIYLRAIKEVTDKGKQALVLIPEIGLAPQTEERFRRYFGNRVASFHSAKNERERLDVWLSASKGYLDVVIGTRSSIFLPMPNLGLIVIDEEHDQSFKQSERFKYSARDVALYRAKLRGIQVILASATPSIETLNNALTKKYSHLKLTKRATGAKLPEFISVDLRGKALKEGLSEELLDSIEVELRKKNQVLIFLNRRGYASSLICKHCGWISNCKKCDAHMTVHKNPVQLQCHHCDSRKNIPSLCPLCSSEHFLSYGIGTEKLEAYLRKRFSSYSVLRIDSDTTKRKDSFKKLLSKVRKNHPIIMVGTQLLAKGHHFPNVTLVGIVDADSGLFSADFRGTEKVAQTITQVAGRAGRDKKPGKVIVQTYCPDHPHIKKILEGSYDSYALRIIEERKNSHSPPFSFQAKVQAESLSSNISRNFLSILLKESANLTSLPSSVRVVGPLPSIMEKKSGLYRWEINLFSNTRTTLHQTLDLFQTVLNKPPSSKKVRWLIDVDPYSTL